MAQSTEQIASHIEGTRQALGSNVEELERKIRTATDWRHHFEESPLTWVGAAMVGGAILGLSSAREPAAWSPDDVTGKPPRRGADLARTMTSMLDDAGAALVGVAASKIQSFIADTIPDFRDELERRKRDRGRTAL